MLPFAWSYGFVSASFRGAAIPEFWTIGCRNLTSNTGRLWEMLRIRSGHRFRQIFRFQSKAKADIGEHEMYRID